LQRTIEVLVYTDRDGLAMIETAAGSLSEGAGILNIFIYFFINFHIEKQKSDLPFSVMNGYISKFKLHRFPVALMKFAGCCACG
jgi:hypothetical protein